MKFEEMFLSLLAEQVPPEDMEPIVPRDDEDDENLPGEPGNDDGFADDIDNDETHPSDQKNRDNQPVKPPKVKQLSPIKILKNKWKKEMPGLTDDVMDESIEFFNRRKNGLRPYNPNGGNQPEINALYAAFENLREILKDKNKIKDIQNYSWAEIEFYMDRVSTITGAREMNYNVDGVTEDEKLKSILKKWDKSENLVFDESNIKIYRIEGTDESIGLGRYQNYLVNKYGGSYWCVTYDPNSGLSNRFSYYRNQGISFYFVLDKNKEMNDPHYLSTIESVDMNSMSRSQGPYRVTPRGNGTSTQKTWDDIVAIHPQLLGKEKLFPTYGKTKKEEIDFNLSKINFNTSNNYSFIKLHLRVQQFYIDHGKLIPNVTAISILPDKLLKDYIDRTSLEDYKNRFKSDNPNDPFGILNYIQREKPSLFRFLDEIKLRRELHVTRGVNGIKEAILGINYKRGFSDIERPYVQYFGRYNDICGVMNIETTEWVKPMEYNGRPASIPMVGEVTDNNGVVKKATFISNKYMGANDSFYFLFRSSDLTIKTSPNYMKGIYLESDKMEELLASGKFKQLKY